MTRHRPTVFGLLAVVLCAGAAAHPATERFIPVGYWQSIGVKGTYVGPLTGVAPRAESLNFVENGAQMSVRITDKTKIWIDRSHLGKKNSVGTRRDLKAGIRTEIKMSTSDPGAAQWIKIRAER